MCNCSSVSKNSATAGAGGVGGTSFFQAGAGGQGGSAYGGGIIAIVSASVDSSKVSGNCAKGGAGGMGGASLNDTGGGEGGDGGDAQGGGIRTGVIIKTVPTLTSFTSSWASSDGHSL